MDIETWTKNCRVKLTSVGGFILMLTEGRSGNMGKNKGKVPRELNFNPYVIIPSTGEKKYYQRPYCWTLEDEQLFIESIYNELDCGKVVLRTNNISEVMEAFIRKIDRHKRKAWLEIEMFGRMQRVEVGLEIISKTV